MVGGGTVGRAILTLIDALVAGALVAFVAWYVVPIFFLTSRLRAAIVVGGLTAGVVFAVAFVLLGLGKRPFPATRLAKALHDRLPWWA